VERSFAPLVARCQGVETIIPCDLRRWRKRPFARQTRQEWAKFKAALRAQAYDAVIDLQGLTKSAVLGRVARTAPKGLRYGLANATEGSSYEAPARWLVDRPIRLEPHVHVVERSRLLCAAALGYTVEGPAHFGLQASGAGVTVAANPFVTRKPLVALVHGTSRADKEWPLAFWVTLAQRLNHEGFGVALAHGNTAEKARSEKIAQQVEAAWVWPSMPLDALADTMARCAGVIGVDSGLSHIAVALGLPHVQIYNFDTAWRTGVSNARQVSVFASPYPDVETVWQAWQGLSTPVLSR
jgi:heptosyltransferase-1